MSQEQKFTMESLEDQETICKYLEALQESFQKGSINLSNSEKNLYMEPRGLIKFFIKAKKKNGEVKLSLGFKWAEDQDMESASQDADKHTNNPQE